MWYNAIMIGLLKSPLHFFVSKNMMLVNYTGRKSGKNYTVPVNYVRAGETLYTTSWKERTWWRNLRSGQPITLHVQGKEVAATPTVTEANENVANLLGDYFRAAPNMARYFDVGLDPEGKAIPEDLASAAGPRVVITFKV